VPNFPFVGSSYNGRSASFDAQRTINLYLERSESRTSRSPAMLVGTPGLTLWATTTPTPTPAPSGGIAILMALGII
jgi:3-polyprenyl-4-hydroxybenzoate decarboxylase